LNMTWLENNFILDEEQKTEDRKDLPSSKGVPNP